MADQSGIGQPALAHFRQAVALEAAGRSLDALGPLIECLRLEPGFGPGYVNFANILCRFGMLDDALTQAQAATLALPDSLPALLCLAGVQHQRGHFTTAIELYRRVLAQHPGHAGAMSSLGSSLQAAGRLEEALALHALAVRHEPSNADFHYNRADALLAAGAFADGWDAYEWRLRRPHAPTPRSDAPRWRGEPLGGRIILLTAEQGFGDTIQFSRYAPMVALCGGPVVLMVPHPLLRLMRTMRGVHSVVDEAGPPPPVSFHCPLMSLPRLFATTIDTIPAAVPYLHADARQAAAWRAAQQTAGRVRVGLVWAGSAHLTASGIAAADRRRSIKLAAFAPLATVPGVAFYSLQTGSPAEQMRAAPEALQIEDCMAGVDDFADTAVLIAGLDLVITVDTAVAHLAGALGRPVWMLCRADACWRWLVGRDDSPWYPTLRLYRQAQPMQWDDVMMRLTHDLAAFAGERSVLPC